MPKIIDGRMLATNKRRLPTEAFFVDTCVIIEFEDPLSSVTRSTPRDQVLATAMLVDYLKCNDHYARTAAICAAEYYTFIRKGAFFDYQRSQGGNIECSTRAFKELRSNDAEFQSGWNTHLTLFERVFRKTFKLIPGPISDDILNSYRTVRGDFGDHVLFDAVHALPESQRCIFSNDADFLDYRDDFYLLTTSIAMVADAQAARLLIAPGDLPIN